MSICILSSTSTSSLIRILICNLQFFWTWCGHSPVNNWYFHRVFSSFSPLHSLSFLSIEPVHVHFSLIQCWTKYFIILQIFQSSCSASMYFPFPVFTFTMQLFTCYGGWNAYLLSNAISYYGKYKLTSYFLFTPKYR